MDLGAIAVQFAASHPAISNVCMRASSVKQQQQNYSWLQQDVPDELWHELVSQGLLPHPSPLKP